MPHVALLMLQVASTAEPSVPGRAVVGSLARPVLFRSCGSSPDEIIVCGHDADAYRLPKGVPEGRTARCPRPSGRFSAPRRGAPTGFNAPSHPEAARPPRW